MKPSTLLLIASLAANAVFVSLTFFKSPHDAAASAGNSTAASNAGTATGEAGKKSPGASAAMSDKEIAVIAKAWADLQGGDIHTLPDRLRAAGFPPSMVKAIVSAMVYEQFAARRKALIAGQEPSPYWKSQQQYTFDPKTQAELRSIGREQIALLKDLLGADGYLGSEETAVYQKRLFGDLSRDKLDEMQNITSDYNELRQQIYQNANGVLLPEDREKIALIEKEQRADMARLLSPEELENYDLRQSSTANTLRSTLGTFKPTEEEFRAIYRATRAAEEQYGSLSLAINPDQMKQIQAAALANAQAVLPPDRFADLKQATDPQYQQINRLVARLDLPASASVQVVTVQQDTQKQANAIRSNKELSPEQKSAQLSTLAQDATTKISTALGGDRGLEAYKTYGGQWLQNLVPRPPANPMNSVPSATPIK